MSITQIIPIPSIKIIEEEDDLVSVILKSIEEQGYALQNDDVLVIASKVVSVVEKRIRKYEEISPTKEAQVIGKKAHISPEFAQIILDETNNKYIGTVPGAVTTLNKYGLMANAGADQSNVGNNQIILLPEDCKVSAQKIHQKLLERINSYIGIIIADSRTMPMRLGTVGGAIATYGFQSIIDERGKNDLFGRPMHITTRAIADQLATAAELLMGETNERTPFVIIRDYPIKRITSKEEQDINSLITEENCMFIGPLLPCLEEKMKRAIKND
jgi:coenzyme F420-0:L-glutamate ligase